MPTRRLPPRRRSFSSSSLSVAVNWIGLVSFLVLNTADDAAGSLAESVFTTTPAIPEKGQVACFACLTEPPSYTTIDFNELQEKLHTAGMHLPPALKQCKETHAISQPDFEGVDIVTCDHTHSHPSACVKFKGIFQGEEFVYRNCWDRMWRTYRPFDMKTMGKCYLGEGVDFVDTQENHLCFCQEDLCNSAVRSQPAPTLLMTFAAAVLTMVLGRRLLQA